VKNFEDMLSFGQVIAC